MKKADRALEALNRPVQLEPCKETNAWTVSYKQHFAASMTFFWSGTHSVPLSSLA